MPADVPNLCLHLCRDRRYIQCAGEHGFHVVEQLHPNQFLVSEGRHRGGGLDDRLAEWCEFELLLQCHRAGGICLQFHAPEELGLARVQLDAHRIHRDFCRGARRDECELAERMRWIIALVEVGDDLAPLVEDLRGVIAAFHLRHFKHHRSFVIHGDPGFEVSDVEIRVYKISGSRRVVFNNVVVNARLLEVRLLLPDGNGATKQINISVRHRLPVRKLGLGGRNSYQDQRESGNEWDAHRFTGVEQNLAGVISRVRCRGAASFAQNRAPGGHRAGSR